MSKNLTFFSAIHIFCKDSPVRGVEPAASQPIRTGLHIVPGYPVAGGEGRGSAILSGGVTGRGRQILAHHRLVLKIVEKKLEL